MIIEYIEHSRTLSEALNDPTLEPKEDHILDPNIDEQKLEYLYGQMANIVLQLSTLTFPRIGSLDVDANGHISVSGRPITMNMNNLVEHTNIPPSILPTHPHNYASTTAWYSALADMHLTQLTFQHNDAIADADDARDKYVARQLFRRLAREGRLSSPSPSPSTPATDESSQFCLFARRRRGPRSQRHRLGICLRGPRAVQPRPAVVAAAEEERGLLGRWARGVHGGV